MKLFGSMFLVYVVVFLAGVIGWIMNIVKITDCVFSPLSSEAVIRVIGSFIAPIGAVLGYIGHF